MTTRVLTSDVLRRHGFPHGFSTRVGGVSPAPFASLNLGFPQALEQADAAERIGGCSVGDLRHNEPARIERNTAVFLDACGLGRCRPARARQVHGARTVDAAEAAPGCEADAIVSVDPDLAAMVRTADCVPILVACPRAGCVAAIHAGWRGLVEGVIGSAVDRLVGLGASRDALVASIGPSIGWEVYEIGEEVAARFVAAGLDAAVRRGSAKPRLDCHRAARDLLLRAGVAADRVDGEPVCTYRNEREFFSARRDGAISGRLGAAIAPRPR